jgi:hypothetical protein
MALLEQQWVRVQEKTFTKWYDLAPWPEDLLMTIGSIASLKFAKLRFRISFTTSPMV